MSLSFGGSTEWFTIANTHGIPSGSSVRSFAFWIKLASTSARQWAFFQGTGASYQRIGADIQAGGALRIDWFTSYYATGTTLSTGSWYHLIVYVDGSTNVGCYVNGSDTGSTSVPSLGTANTTFYLGANSSTSNPINGEIAEFGVWDVKLDDDEAQALYKGFSPKRIRQSGLVLYMPCDSRKNPVTSTGTVTENGSVSVTEHPRIYP